MAAGKAIAAPDQANIREILASGISALLFEPDATESMEDVILRLANDAQLRHRLGQAARELISSRGYTWRHNAERVCMLGSEAIRRNVRTLFPAAL
jgi:D-inositol-3-phosphate glycosyltransferase